jgi:hypothetical protein
MRILLTAALLPFLVSLTTSPSASSTYSNEVSITVEGGQRIIKSNGIPDHPTGKFPNPSCPNTITPQNYNHHITANPQVAEKSTALGMSDFGVALNGVVFDPGAAEWWGRNPFSGWQYEPLSGNYYLGTDENNAHVQPNGSYHYHGIPTGLVKKLNGENTMVQLGWAADGFPIYGQMGHADAKDLNSPALKLKSSYQVKKGVRPSGLQGPGGKYDGTFLQDYEYVAGSGDLDEHNGRFGATPEFPSGTYHYYLTDSWPFIPRSYKGTPDASFKKGPPAGRRPMRRGGPGGPPGGPFGPPPFPPPPGFGPR